MIQKKFKIKYVYRRMRGQNQYRYEKTAKDLKNEAIDLEYVTKNALFYIITFKGNLYDMFGRIRSEKGP